MIIICPNCTTHFNVDPTVLGGGKNARCFNCSHSWFQEPVSVPPPAMPQMASYPAMAQPMSGQPISGEQPGAPPGYGQPIHPLAPPPAPEPTPVPEPVPEPKAGPEPEPEPEPEIEASGDMDDILSSEQRDEMFGDDDEPKPVESLMPGESADDEGDDILDPEDIPEPEPIPQGLTADEGGDEDVPKKRSIGKIIGIASAVIVVALLGGVFALKSMIVEMVPAMSAFYDIIPFVGEEFGDGLDIGQVKSVRETDGSIEVLVVRGIVTNVSGDVRPVPLIRVTLFDGDGNEVQHIDTAPIKNQLKAGDEIRFKLRLKEPSALARRLEVTFAKPEAPAQ